MGGDPLPGSPVRGPHGHPSSSSHLCECDSKGKATQESHTMAALRTETVMLDMDNEAVGSDCKH